MTATMAATMNFRGVLVRTLSDAVGDLATIRASAYAAYRCGPGVDSEYLPGDLRGSRGADGPAHRPAT